jgi:hypothetical protein
MKSWLEKISSLVKEMAYLILAGIDSPRPPISGFKKKFMAWDDDVKNQFFKAVNAWHGTTMQDNDPDLLIHFASEHSKEMGEYQDWLRSLAEDSLTLYRGFAGKYAEEIAEKAWDAYKNKKAEIKVDLKTYTPWSTNSDVARHFGDAVVIKYDWPKKNVFHADAGRGFLKQLGYPVKLSRTEREIVIKTSESSISVDVSKDIRFLGKFRARQLRLDKKIQQQKNEDFASKLQEGKKYPVRKSDFSYWEDLREKGGLIYRGKSPEGLLFEYPDKSVHPIKDVAWISDFLLI